MKARDAWVLGLATALGMGCVAGEDAQTSVGADEQRIVGGEASAGDAATVAIGARRVGCGDALVVRCTGVLVAPRVVLTAAHCVADPRLGADLEVLFGAGVDDPDARFDRVVEIALHPDYRADAGAEEAAGADLAALILAREAEVEPALVNPSSLDGAVVGAEVRVVGFGQPSSTDTATGHKRAGTARISAVDADTVRIEAAPAMTCRGDSGGPTLARLDGDAVESVVGVTSRGDPGCAEYGLATRVDRHLDGFIEPWIEAARTWPSASSPPPSGADGLCQRVCVVDDDCPAGLRCRPSVEAGGPVSRCQLPGLLAGELGALCNDDDACADRCVRTSPDECRCHQVCPSVIGQDPDGEVPPGDGGCTASRPCPALPNALWLILPTLVCCIRRRGTRRYPNRHIVE
ncbi:S1 family peptidase [Haliangium sp.]|uniref:S1 family peptidase n=2 Tax=Haliangium sp. TaxID=2663208 RepID=UPI003D0A141E